LKRTDFLFNRSGPIHFFNNTTLIQGNTFMLASITRCAAALVLLFTVALVLPRHEARASDASEAQALVLKSDAVFRSFMADPNMKWFHKNSHRARGIFIVPQMLRGGFIIGGSGGSGVLLTRDTKTGVWSYPAFYTMGSVSIGLQIGADASELVLLVMTDKGINAMLSNEFKLGADVAVAAGPVGATAKAQTADVLAFGRSKGAFGGVTIEGAVIAPRDKWNAAFYGKPVSPVDILIKRTVANPQAEALRKALPPLRPTAVKPLGS
jgi:lipid-binding SYLF domain-containing protein